MTDTPTPAPVGAPAPAPDLERHARTSVTRLPYLLVVLAALVVLSVLAGLSWHARQTAPTAIVGVGPAPVLQQPANATPR